MKIYMVSRGVLKQVNHGKYHRIPWYTMVYHGIPWHTMVYHGIPWYTTEYLTRFAIQAKGPAGKWTRKPLAYRESNNVHLLIARPPGMVYHGILWNTMVYFHKDNLGKFFMRYSLLNCASTNNAAVGYSRCRAEPMLQLTRVNLYPVSPRDRRGAQRRENEQQTVVQGSKEECHP